MVFSFTIHIVLDSIILDVKTKTIVQRLRDNIYNAMASSRQIDCDTPDISPESCEDQENKAADEKIVESVGEGCSGSKKTKFIVTKDRLLVHKYNQDGFKDHWTDMFLIDLQGVERASPPEYPMWYVWLYWFPPCGLFGGHRHKLGKRGIGLYLYSFVVGVIGLGCLILALSSTDIALVGNFTVSESANDNAVPKPVTALTLALFVLAAVALAPYIFDFFTMLFCVHNLRIKSTVSLVFTDAEGLDFQMKLQKPADGQKILDLVNQEISGCPEMSKSKVVGQYRHVQHPALSDCCKSWFDNTVRETKIDALSISVHEVHKTPLRKICIPPSPCCPICWVFRPCVCFCCKCCYVSTTEIVDQEVYHKTAERVATVNSMPNSSWNSLFQYW